MGSVFDELMLIRQKNYTLLHLYLKPLYFSLYLSVYLIKPCKQILSFTSLPFSLFRNRLFGTLHNLRIIHGSDLRK